MRPPLKPTPASRTQVRKLAALGLSERQIADVIAIDHRTLRKHYADELFQGAERAATARLARILDTISTDNAESLAGPSFSADGLQGAVRRPRAPQENHYE